MYFIVVTIHKGSVEKNNIFPKSAFNSRISSAVLLNVKMIYFES